MLKNGETQGRVELQVAAVPGTYGIGAVEGLRGEVLVNDGVVWVSRASAPDAVAPAGPPLEGEQATLLVLDEVHEWSESSLPALPDLAALEHELRAAAEAAGQQGEGPFPFVIEGVVAALDLHVLNGACPFASPPPPPEREPYRANLDRTEVTLVGFYAEGLAGKLTHHGKNSHLHVLTGGPLAVVGHVDDLRLLEGARLRVPAR